MLERMEMIAPAHVDSQFHFEFLPVDNMPNPIMKMEQVTAGYHRSTDIKKYSLKFSTGQSLGLAG